jgi:isocitrate dehydrogenase
LLHGALLMLSHIGQGAVAEHVHNAWLRTIEDGIHTYDIYKEGTSAQKVGTKEFADAVIANIGTEPQHLWPARYATDVKLDLAARPDGAATRKTHVGIDVFIDMPNGQPDAIAAKLTKLGVDGVTLTVISNRGTKVWPEGNPDTFWSDHWSCRFEGDGSPFDTTRTVRLIEAIDRAGFDVIKHEGLYSFDGERQYSLAQGQ